MSFAPTIAEELERKTSESVYEVLRQVHAKEIEPDTARSLLKAIWDISSGLVSRELMDLMAESRDALNGAAALPRRHVLEVGNKVVVIDKPDADHMTCFTYISTRDGWKASSSDFDDEGLTLTEALAKTEVKIQSLLQKGFREHP